MLLPVWKVGQTYVADWIAEGFERKRSPIFRVIRKHFAHENTSHKSGGLISFFVSLSKMLLVLV